MRRFVKGLLLMGLSYGIASCMDEVDMSLPSTEAGGVIFTIEDFIPESETKSAFEVSSMKFQWSADDVIGIFPANGWQTQFNMESGAGASTAVFDGGDWGLKASGTYYAYYPFSKENFEDMSMREKVPYSYEGQEACFADENGVVDLGKYDFMASGASTMENGNVNFKFKHLGALCRIRFEAPTTSTYSHMIIEADDAIFPVAGSYDATDKDGDGNIKLVGDSSVEYQLKVVLPSSHQSFAANESVEFYFLMPPVDLSGNSLIFRLISEGLSTYSASFDSKNIEAGSSYGWDVEFPAVFDLSENRTANSYIISGPGTYKFKTVQGNSNTSVGSVNSARVLWETFGTNVTPSVGDLVSNVKYENDHITFTASDKKGNAVIAAKDAKGNILWSWHIWLTDTPKDQVYCNNAGIMMDRNLGATSATPGDVGALGLLYQWGRKDPFLGGSYISYSDSEGQNLEKAKSTLSWPSPVTSDSSIGTIAYATSHPTTFIKRNISNGGDWYYTGSSSIYKTRWQSSKTIYDPCPAGYRVPDGGESGVWSTAFGQSDSFYEDAFDSTNKGFNLSKSNTTKYLTEETSCWYPASGELDHSDGALDSAGRSGFYWSCGAYSFTCYGWGFIHPSNGGDRALGNSVRCLRE